MDLRITGRARSEVDALSAAEYVEVATVAAAIRGSAHLVGGRFGVVDNQYDVYAREVPGTNWLMLLVCDPANPQTAAFAGLWRDGNMSPVVKEQMARQAAAALGWMNPNIYVF